VEAPNTLEEDAERRCTDSLKPWNDGPGTISLASATVAIVGLVVTLMLMALLLHLLGRYRLEGYASLAKQLSFQAPTFALAALFCVHASYRNPLSLSLRVASWLPLIHLVLLVAGMSFYIVLLESDPDLARNFALLDLVSLGWGALAICSVFIVGLLVHGIRSEGQRQPLFLYPLAICCLTFTLLLGLWLPIAAEIWIPLDLPIWSRDPLEFHGNFLWIAMLRPVAARRVLSAVLTGARKERMFAGHGFRLFAGTALAILLIIAVGIRANTNLAGILVYANLLPVLFCGALLSLVAVIAIAISHWLALRAIRNKKGLGHETQVGVVAVQPGNQAPGRLHYLGWALGLRCHCAPFILRTARGDIPIPGGARLLAGLPLWTSRSRKGDSSPILSVGDRVRVSGFVAPPKDNAFRRSELPVPGSRGLVLVKLDDDETSLSSDLALILWRPAILYLAIMSIVALPGLAGFLSF
jgi:hypothetical protein